MSAEQFHRRGVRFQRDQRGRLFVEGPDDPELVAAVRAAIEQRLELVRKMPPAQERGSSMCDACWDSLPIGKGGICELCELAREKVLKQLTELWRIDAPTMKGAPCFAMVVIDGVVREIAPYARWAFGEPFDKVREWFEERGAKVERVGGARRAA